MGVWKDEVGGEDEAGIVDERGECGWGLGEGREGAARVSCCGRMRLRLYTAWQDHLGRICGRMIDLRDRPQTCPWVYE